MIASTARQHYAAIPAAAAPARVLPELAAIRRSRLESRTGDLRSRWDSSVCTRVQSRSPPPPLSMGNSAPRGGGASLALDPEVALEHRLLSCLRSNDWMALARMTNSEEMRTLMDQPNQTLRQMQMPWLTREEACTWRERMRPPADSSLSSQLALNAVRIRSGFPLLHQAVCCCSPLMIQRMLEAGADANLTSSCDVHLCGRDAALLQDDRYLYQHILDPTRPRAVSSWSLSYSDRLRGNLNAQIKYRDERFTPIMLAIIFAEFEQVCEVSKCRVSSCAAQALALQLRAATDWLPLCFPPLCCVQICELLLWAGADVNAATLDSGWTPLMFASQRCNPALLDLLLSYSASPAALSEHGSAAEIARTFGGDRCAEAFDAAIQRRLTTRAAVDAALGEEAGMAAVCVEMCLAYLGTAATADEAAAAPPAAVAAAAAAFAAAPAPASSSAPSAR